MFGALFDPVVVSDFLLVVERGVAGFFRNSAAKVDRSVLASGLDRPITRARYLRRGMVADWAFKTAGFGRLGG